MPNSPRWPPAPQKNLIGAGWDSFTNYGIMSGESAQLTPAPSCIGTSYTTSSSGALHPAVSGPGDFQLQSGGGRLDAIYPFPRGTSGLSTPVTFYDAAAATSGGPFVLSGHRILATIPAFVQLISGALPTPAASGVSTAVLPTVTPVPDGFPFLSGLCVAIKSGQPPFTISFSAEGGVPAM